MARTVTTESFTIVTGSFRDTACSMLRGNISPRSVSAQKSAAISSRPASVILGPFPSGRTALSLFARPCSQQATGGARLLVCLQDRNGIDTTDNCCECSPVKMEFVRNLRHVLEECFGTRPQAELHAGPITC